MIYINYLLIEWNIHLFTYRLLDLASIKEIYDDIEIQTNEEKEIELGFKTKKMLETLLRLQVDYLLYIVKLELDILCN